MTDGTSAGGPAMDGAVTVAEAGGVRRIRIDRPGKANALSAAMMAELAAAIAAPGSAALAVIEGAGPRGFCAGADIGEFIRGAGNLARQEEGLRAIVEACLSSPRPLVAAIHGRTLGAGVLIAALCDVVLAADDLAFGLPEIRFNMYPVLVHAVLEEKVSPATAFQMCAGGRLVDAAEARALGLVTDILPAAGFAAGVEPRLAFYRDNAEALSIGRRARQVLKPSDLPARMDRLAPLMHENFHRPGVRETIARYLGGLGRGG